MGQVIDRKNIVEFLNDLRKTGKTIVTTNGCFDILHVGHVRYLQKTKTTQLNLYKVQKFSNDVVTIL